MLDPLDVFRARCEARALLWAAGAFGNPDDPSSLHTAVDGLLPLSPSIGIDASQEMMAAAFESARAPQRSVAR